MTMLKSMLVLSALSIAATNVVATDWCDVSPFAGVDYKYSHLGGRGEWRNAISHKYNGENIYVGFKFHDNFGLEAGYEQTAKKSKTVTAINGNIFGKAVGQNAQAKYNTKMQMYHLDLNYYYPVQECLELVGSLGVGLIDPKVTLEKITAANGAITLYGRQPMKHTLIARVRAGAQYMFTEIIGFRGLLGFDNTSQAKFKGRNELAISTATTPNLKPFRDTYSVSLGIFAKF